MKFFRSTEEDLDNFKKLLTMPAWQFLLTIALAGVLAVAYSYGMTWLHQITGW